MAYNEEIAKRIQQALLLIPEDFTEKKMFGGIAFLYHGKMTVGVVKDELMVRVMGNKMESVLQQEYARPMDFTGKPMKEFVFVSPQGFRSEEQLQRWIELGLEHAKTKL
ncbi:TfoX/Sxy family protein [Muricauda sp. CAU 1633]|uniref:TfoX/Sxy family protein n=1 Tax=Allomuricauda sp. CAU 1633 TaxID=2816036 RepID=UPI001A8E091C|nr:TfoX/Sxy family protein [Muricauda sp. CAU 1633]MBO0323588.1 TfoX/Sxy family protein [Muricauda sp. CAU 1633]